MIVFYIIKLFFKLLIYTLLIYYNSLNKSLISEGNSSDSSE